MSASSILTNGGPLARDKSAITAVYREHIAMVRGRARRLLGNKADAEDAAQEAFVRLINHWDGVDQGTVRALLYRTVSNLCLNRIRDTGRRGQALASLPPREAETPQLDASIILRQALAVVSEEEAEVASYYYVDGLTQREVSDLLGVQRRRVGRLLDSFRKKARSHLEGSP